MLGGRDIATTVFDDHFHDKWDIIGQIGNHQIFVDYFDRLIRFNVSRCDWSGRVSFDTQDFGRVAVVLDHKALNVEHDVGDIF